MNFIIFRSHTENNTKIEKTASTFFFFSNFYLSKQGMACPWGKPCHFTQTIKVIYCLHFSHTTRKSQGWNTDSLKAGVWEGISWWSIYPSAYSSEKKWIIRQTDGQIDDKYTDRYADDRQRTNDEDRQVGSSFCKNCLVSVSRALKALWCLIQTCLHIFISPDSPFQFCASTIFSSPYHKYNEYRKQTLSLFSACYSSFCWCMTLQKGFFDGAVKQTT